MIELKLIDWKKFEAVYSWKGLYVVGTAYGSNTFKWRFPEIKANKNDVIYLKKSSSYIMFNYFISRYGGSMQKHLEGECKRELEEELEKELKDPLNQKVLLMMVLDDALVTGEYE
jgi:hypothetical protein